MPSLTTNKLVKSPSTKAAKQTKSAGREFKGKGIEDSSNPQGGVKNKMSVGVSTKLHGKAIGGHPTSRASEFNGKGRGYHTKMG